MGLDPCAEMELYRSKWRAWSALSPFAVAELDSAVNAQLILTEVLRPPTKRRDEDTEFADFP